MLNKNVISIDIGTHTTKLVVGSYNRKKVSILHMDSLTTPLNSINDGQVLDINKIKDMIKKSLDKIKVKSKKVIFTLDSTSIITRELALPYAKNEELERILSFEIGQYFPTDLDEYIIQSQRLYDFEDEDAKKTKVLAAALPRLIVKNYLELLNSLELEPLALDVHFNGIAKLFNSNCSINNKQVDEKQTYAVIDLGYDNINVNIINKKVLRFNRLLTVGGKEIDLGIANNFDFSMQQAQKVKIEQSTFDEDNASPLYFAIEEVIKGSIDSWLEEIQRIFKFYTSRNPKNRIDKIYLHGGHSNLNNITKYFESFFDIPTENITDVSCIDTKTNDAKDIPVATFLNAISAVIRK